MTQLTLGIILGIVVFGATQCGSGVQIASPTSQNPPNLQRVIDDEAGVVCWKFEGYRGIDCMPIEETRLKR